MLLLASDFFSCYSQTRVSVRSKFVYVLIKMKINISLTHCDKINRRAANSQIRFDVNGDPFFCHCNDCKKRNLYEGSFQKGKKRLEFTAMYECVVIKL